MKFLEKEFKREKKLKERERDRELKEDRGPLFV